MVDSEKTEQAERKYTPLLLSVAYRDRGHGHGDYGVIDQSGRVIAPELSKDEAEFLVLTVNSHYNLLDALREAEKVIIYAAQESRGRVKAEIVNGWIHHSTLIAAAISDAK